MNYQFVCPLKRIKNLFKKYRVVQNKCLITTYIYQSEGIHPGKSCFSKSCRSWMKFLWSIEILKIEQLKVPFCKIWKWQLYAFSSMPFSKGIKITLWMSLNSKSLLHFCLYFFQICQNILHTISKGWTCTQFHLWDFLQNGVEKIAPFQSPQKGTSSCLIIKISIDYENFIQDLQLLLKWPFPKRTPSPW